MTETRQGIKVKERDRSPHQGPRGARFRCSLSTVNSFFRLRNLVFFFPPVKKDQKLCRNWFSVSVCQISSLSHASLSNNFKCREKTLRFFFPVLFRYVESLFGPTRISSPWGNFSDGGLNQSINQAWTFIVNLSIDWLIDDKLTLTWLVYWIRTAQSVFTGAGLKWPNITGQNSTSQLMANMWSMGDNNPLR